MAERLATRRALLLGGATLVGGFDAGAEPARSQPLFVIARSKNANVVHYDARTRSGGRLDPDEPIIAYWVMHAENARRESLTWLERRFAYGFESAFEPGGEVLRVRLRAFSRRELEVARDGRGRFRAHVTIGGRPAVLERIFVCTDEGSVTPSVRYLDLGGSALSDGGPVGERIRP
jgi:hypothetical protein